MTTTMRGRLRRASGAMLAGVMTMSVAWSAPVSAQTARPPAPAPIEGFCANVADGHDPFADVGAGDTSAAAIRCLEHAAIALGASPGSYAPAGTVTRAQMASFLVRMMETASTLDTGAGVDGLAPYEGSNGFADVSDDGTHVANINRLAAAGVTVGGPGNLPATSFGPLLPVTREQMASFISRAIEHLTGAEVATGEDFFADDQGSTHEANINALAARGIAVGDGSTTFQPGASLTRGQMAAFLARSLATLEADGVIGAFPDRGAVPLVLASDAGVEVVAGDGSTTKVSETPAATAYGVGDDLVVFQGSEDFDDIHPPEATGPVQLWSGGEVSDLATDPSAASVRLLTAGIVDGAAVALVAEHFGDSIDDAVERLVLIDLLDGARTEGRSWPSWESGHIGAALLPDGDVVGLHQAETFVTVSRFSLGSEEPVWFADVGQDIRVKLAVGPGGVAVVERPYESGAAADPTLTVQHFDVATGEAGPVRALQVAGADAAIETRLSCGAWLFASELACSRRDGPPVAVSAVSGAVDPLAGGTGAIPTVVRMG